MSEAHAEHSEHEAGRESGVEEAVVEADKPDNRLIFVLVNVVIVAILGMVIAGWQIFMSSMNAEIDKKVWKNAGGATELREVRAQEDGSLGHYQWVSQKDGVVRVPVARARELVLRDWNLPRVAPATSAPTAPAPVDPAASASAAPSASAPTAPSASAAPSTSSKPAASASVKG